jgi:hypothetical protein
MRWRKIGKIFDPSEHALPNGCNQYAQSPQALVFEDFIRIYFSTRLMDLNGKYLSHIAFADFSKDLKTILRTSRNEVIPLGALGAFDEHGIFPLNVLRNKGVIYGYTCGWNRRVSVSVDTAIGLAVSHDDGVTFQRFGEGGPVLAATRLEPCLVGDGFVKVVGDTFHMWYIFGTGWKKYDADSPPDRTYKIGHAVSKDGITWVKEEARQIIPNRIGSEESQALPSVLEIDGVFHMIFCYRESFNFRSAKGRGYRIGHATSIDLINWKRDDEGLGIEGTVNEWDSDMQCYPNIFECDGQVYLLYNGNEFGRHGFGAAILEK